MTSCSLPTDDNLPTDHAHCESHGCVAYRCCVASTTLRVWLGVRDFRAAFAVLPKDRIGTVSVRRIAEHCGSTYLAACERAAALCESGQAGRSGAVTDQRVSLR